MEMEKMKLNILDKTMKNIGFIGRPELNEFIFENNIIDILKFKQKTVINEYLKAIIAPDYSDYFIDIIKYASFQDEDNNKYCIIFLDSKLMYNYSKNLDILRKNFLYDEYFIPVSGSSEKLYIYSKIKKIKYNYNIELSSNLSQNTDIQIESFFSDTMIKKISDYIIDNFGKKIQEILIKNMKKDSKVIKSTIENRINFIINNPKAINDFENQYLIEKMKEILESYTIPKVELEKNSGGRHLKEIREFDEKYLYDNFQEHDLSKDDILFLLNLLINTDNKKENIINQLELCYNILLFNLLIEKKEYDKIKELIYYSLNIKDFSNKTISQLFLIKLFDDKDIIKNLYFNLNNRNIKEFDKYNKEYDSLKSLENDIDNILKIFAPFCIPFKKVKYLSEEYISSIGNKSEKISAYLEGFNLEEEIKNIILRENENIVPLRNLYYILLKNNITFIEFDLICLVKDNEILKFHDTLFDRVSSLYNINFLGKLEDILGLSLIFFEIKISQHSNQGDAKHLIEKVDFLYPLFKKFLLQYYNTDIEKCKIYFIHIFDTKFNSNFFVSTKISDLRLKLKYLNKNKGNQCKLIFSYVEKNVGQYNIRKLTKDIKNLKGEILNLKDEISKRKEKKNDRMEKFELEILNLKNELSKRKEKKNDHTEKFELEILNLKKELDDQEKRHQTEINQLKEQIKKLMKSQNLSGKPKNLENK